MDDELPPAASWAVESGGLEKDGGGGRESMTEVVRSARKAYHAVADAIREAVMARK
jgi:hypothetical protein